MPIAKYKRRSALGHRLHQKRERPPESLFSRRRAFEVSEANHDEIVRGDDDRGLPSRARHVVCLFGNRKRLGPIDPEEPAVDRPSVRRPRRSDGAHELRVAFGKDPLADPDAVLEIQIPEPRPAPSRPELLSLKEEVPVRVGLDDHVADSDLVEERAPGKRKILLASSLDPETDQVVEEDGVAVAVTAHGVRGPLLRPGRGPLERVGTAGIEVEVIEVTESGVEAGLPGRPASQAG